MRYLGTLRGAGVLKSGDDATGVPATYDFDGFLRKNDQVASWGEIRMSAAALRTVFGRRDLCLLTEDRRVLHLSFAEKKLGAAGDAVPVDVSGELPGPLDWRH
jgi:hypothetical protein